MKLLLLLIAVYALIINQSSKSDEALRKGDPEPMPSSSAAEAVSPQSGPRDLVAPVFSYSTIVLLQHSTVYTRLEKN